MKGCRPLSQDEIERVEKAFGPSVCGLRNLAWFRMGYMTGLRVSELLSLRLGDVWRDGLLLDEVLVRRAARKRKTEGIRVYVPTPARSALRAWLEKARGAGVMLRRHFVFCQPATPQRAIGKKHVWRILKQTCERVGVVGAIGTHTMRKTFAQRFYENVRSFRNSGEDLDPMAELKQALGHKKIESTISYLRLDGQNTRGLSQRIWER